MTGELVHWLEASISPRLSVGSKVMAQWRNGGYYSGTVAQSSGAMYLIVWDDGSPQQWTPTSQIQPQAPGVRVTAQSLVGGLFMLLGGTLAALVFGSPVLMRLRDKRAPPEQEPPPGGTG